MSVITEKICQIANIDNFQVIKQLVQEVQTVDLLLLADGRVDSNFVTNVEILLSLVKTSSHSTEGISHSETVNLHSIVWEICLPILKSINPSDDCMMKRQILILICELLVECLKRTSHSEAHDVLGAVRTDLQKLCNEPEHLSPHFGTGHNHQTSESVRLSCWVEFLQIFLLTNNSHTDEIVGKIFDEIFTLLLSTFPYVLERVFAQVVSKGIFHLLRVESEKRDHRLCTLWDMVEHLSREGKQSVDKVLQMFCSLADFLFPVVDKPPIHDLRANDTFWKMVQQGMYSENPLTRKRSLYLMKRIVDTCEKRRHNVNASDDSIFQWRIDSQKYLSRTWEDFILLVETLEEKQVHVIKPVFGRMQTLIKAASGDEQGWHLHTSWLVTVLCRCFQHESPQVVRWAVDSVLSLDLNTCPLVKQHQLWFLTGDFIAVLQELRLYQRPAGVEFGRCPPVGLGLRKFLSNCILAQTTNEAKAHFLQTLLESVLSRTWGSIPLFYLSHALADVPPAPIMSPNILALVKDMVMTLMTTLEPLPKGAIQCFLLQTVLHLADQRAVSVEEFAGVLGVVERRESLQRGTWLWGEVVNWLEGDLVSEGQWGQDNIQTLITTMVHRFLADTEEISGSTQSTKVARLFVLSVDAGVFSASTEGEDKMAAILHQMTDIINSINSHAYMSTVKSDRAVALLLSVVREYTPVASNAEELGSSGVARAVRGCWQQLTLYVGRRISQDIQEVELLHLLELYSECLAVCAPYLSPTVGELPLLALANTCVNTLNVARHTTPTHQDEQLVLVAAISLLAAIADIITSSPGLDDTGALTTVIKDYSQQMTITSVFPKLPARDNQRANVSQKDWGRVVSQYISSQWQCLHFSLLKSMSLPHHVLDLVHDAFDVGTRHSNVHVMHCASFILPKLVTEEPERVCETILVAWSKATEELHTATYWQKLGCFAELICQPQLLLEPPGSPVNNCLQEYMSLFFAMGEEKMGVANLLMERLFIILVSESGITVANNFISLLVDACVFGGIHKRTDRLVLELAAYIEGQGHSWSVNDVMDRFSKNDNIVRVHLMNFLCRLDPTEESHVDLALALADRLYEKYNSLLEAADYRHYNNSLCHRQKNRIFQALCVLEPFVSPGRGGSELWQFVWHCLVVEGHPSVRHMQEWLVMRQIHRFPDSGARLWEHFNTFSDKRNLSLCSLMHILSRVGLHLPSTQQCEFYSQALSSLLPWCLAHHFNTRVHAQASLAILWQQCHDLGLHGLLAQHSILQTIQTFHADNNNSTKNLHKLINNYFYHTFDFLTDYSLETLFLTLPRLAILTDEEWVRPAVFIQWDATWGGDSQKLLPLHNPNTRLRECSPGPWKIKPPVDTDKDDAMTEGDVQKKIMPWRLMTPGDGEAVDIQANSKKLHKPGGLVLVTSLVDKLPNLGGLCRTSEIFGVSEFVIGSLCYVEDRTFQSLSVTAQNWIPITEVAAHRLQDFLQDKRRDGYTLVGAEQTANSISLTQYKFPAKTLLLLGNEKEGIPVNLIQLLDVCVEIPQQGIIRSLNVHVSGALLVWEYARQQIDTASQST